MSLSPEELSALHANNTRQCAIMHPGGFRPTGNPLATRFGGLPMALQGEGWPTNKDRYHSKLPPGSGVDVPSGFVCQINLTDAPFVPDCLKDIAFITVFCGYDMPDPKHGGRGGPMPFEEAVTIRAYRSLEGLQPLDLPDGPVGDWLTPFECRWEMVNDQPCYDDDDLWLPQGRAMSDDDTDYVHDLDNIAASKLGGYFTSTQHEGSWGCRAREAAPTYAFQIASETKCGLYWIHDGILGIARGTAPGHEDTWVADIQFY